MTRPAQAYRRSAGKEMEDDTTYEMERRRNRPVKYDREHMATTLRAMKVVYIYRGYTPLFNLHFQSIATMRTRREAAFHKNRMGARLEQEKREAASMLAKAPASLRTAEARTEKSAAIKELKRNVKLSTPAKSAQREKLRTLRSGDKMQVDA